jgi:ribosome-associated heat shock protein Hsp15
MTPAESTSDRVRLDKWLWAARFYKTRSLATTAVSGGKVQLNGERAKPGKLVRVGDQLRVRQGPYEFWVRVLGLAERRGPASLAALLYEESEASRRAREALSLILRQGGLQALAEGGRPTKRDRRDLRKFKRKD